ncbi:MAG TPA: MOSC N-terminal beta barrel domain-containing protein [Streptosporangiaceae bacterium]|nr:MOSC N-terminal beta barrel domain-containing protein [Streptosporangiaceae bacterium]
MDSAGHATIASIHIYPVKAGQAVDLTEAEVEPCGLAGDRRWLVTDPDGQFITQRAEPTLALVCARYSAGGSLRLSAAGEPPLRVPAPAEGHGAEMLWVTVWESKVRAAGAGEAADAWFSRFLGRPVRLVHLDDPTRRQVDPEFSAPGDRVSFADGYPLLLTSMGSLDALNQWLIEDSQPAVPMTRFRPSVVVAGLGPWAEDGWRRIRIGTVPFRVAKPCGRCVVTTIDQQTAERGREPLAMLGRRRRFGQQLVFGQNLIPDATGTIRAGDPVQVLDAGK